MDGQKDRCMDGGRQGREEGVKIERRDAAII